MRSPPCCHSPCSQRLMRESMCPVMKSRATVAPGGRAAGGPLAAAAPSTPEASAPGGRLIRSATTKLHRSLTPCSAARSSASTTQARSISSPTQRQPCCVAAWWSTRPSPQPRSHSTSSRVRRAALKMAAMRAEAHGTNGESERGPVALHSEPSGLSWCWPSPKWKARSRRPCSAVWLSMTVGSRHILVPRAGGWRARQAGVKWKRWRSWKHRP